MFRYIDNKLFTLVYACTCSDESRTVYVTLTLYPLCHLLQAEEEDLLNIDLPSPDLKPGILPTEIRKLVESRRQVKSLMKQEGLSQEQLMQVGELLLNDGNF